MVTPDKNIALLKYPAEQSGEIAFEQLMKIINIGCYSEQSEESHPSDIVNEVNSCGTNEVKHSQQEVIKIVLDPELIVR